MEMIGKCLMILMHLAIRIQEDLAANICKPKSIIKDDSEDIYLYIYIDSYYITF